MPKKANATQKKRRVKRGFKTRSQRGGLFGFFEDSTSTQPKQSWGDWFNGLVKNPNETQPTYSTQPTYPTQPTYSTQPKTLSEYESKPQQVYPTQGGKRKHLKCKKHHRHTKSCK
jgi:hypothetical protein